MLCHGAHCVCEAAGECGAVSLLDPAKDKPRAQSSDRSEQPCDIFLSHVTGFASQMRVMCGKLDMSFRKDVFLELPEGLPFLKE